MTKAKQEKLHQLLEEQNPVVRETLYAMHWEDIVLDIAHRYQLSPYAQDALYTEVVLLLTASADPEDFPEEISTRCRTDAETTQHVVHDVYHELLFELRERIEALLPRDEDYTEPAIAVPKKNVPIPKKPDHPVSTTKYPTTDPYREVV